MDQLENQRVVVEQRSIVEQTRIALGGDPASGADVVEAGAILAAFLALTRGSSFDDAARREPDPAIVTEDLHQRTVDFPQETQPHLRFVRQRGQVVDGDIAFAEIIDLDKGERNEAIGIAAIDDAFGVKLVLCLRCVQGLAGVGQHERTALALEQQRIAVDGFEDGNGLLAQFAQQTIETQFHNRCTLRSRPGRTGRDPIYPF